MDTTQHLSFYLFVLQQLAYPASITALFPEGIEDPPVFMKATMMQEAGKAVFRCVRWGTGGRRKAIFRCNGWGWNKGTESENGAQFRVVVKAAMMQEAGKAIFRCGRGFHAYPACSTAALLFWGVKGTRAIDKRAAIQDV